MDDRHHYGPSDTARGAAIDCLPSGCADSSGLADFAGFVGFVRRRERDNNPLFAPIATEEASVTTV